MLRSASRRLYSAAAPSFSKKNKILAAPAVRSRIHGPSSSFNLHKSFFSTQLSSFGEPDPTLSHHATDANDPDAPLRHDIRTMGSLLGKVIRQHQGDAIYEKVETMRQLAKEWRASDKDTAVFDNLTQFAQQLTNTELYSVSRAFTHFLAMANAAEGHHRIRRLRESSSHALYDKKDSCGGVLPDLVAQGIAPQQIWETLSQQCVELVLTAHPTEVNRRTILQKHGRIQEILTAADAQPPVGDQKTFAQEQLDQALWNEISGLWLSDEVSRKKPTPEDEAERGTLVVETVLWDTLPLFLRKLDASCQHYLEGRRLPLEARPLKFASWMGGDRDGNPNVKPDTTRTVCLRNRGKAARLFRKDLEKLESELSLTTCSAELREIVGGESREPYRVFLRPMIEKLRQTEAWTDEELLHVKESPRRASRHLDEVSVEDVYLSKAEFMSELQLIHRSLTETGNEMAADGLVTDIIRKLSAFGLTLIPLDVRQESTRHEEALDAITRFLGLGSYSQWDETTKISWLSNQIASKRPLLRNGVWYEHPDIFSETTIDTLEIFRMIADQYEDSLGAYVISQATHASDVLAVLLLQLDAGVKKPLRVAPLFETLDDLNGACATMRSLFSLPVYMGVINGKQEIMIGYSDSAKDAGRLSAVYAQYETQMELAALAREFSVDMSFFHGKGGTVGRGGGPKLFEAILAHAPDTINGQFRVTEQGEMIQKNFGHGDRAERTLDIYTAAVLAEKLTERPKPPQEWKDLMTELSAISCEAYRNVVRHDERFVPYFRSATPEVELASLNIGSRPAKRNPTGGVESLRAIPWNFAWTQTRFNLPTWLGVGEAIRKTLESDKAGTLREMYQKWDSFRTMVDLVEMVLAKSEPAIAQHYDSTLVKDHKAKELGSEVRSVHVDTEKAILDLTEHNLLGEDNQILQRALYVRNPYVDCLNVLQVETLKRIRDNGGIDEDKILKDALMTTIGGVANGMGNTG